MKDSLLLQPATRAGSTNASLGSQSSSDNRWNDTGDRESVENDNFSKEFDKSEVSNDPTTVTLSREETVITQNANTLTAGEVLSAEAIVLASTDLNLDNSDTRGNGKSLIPNTPSPENAGETSSIFHTIKSDETILQSPEQAQTLLQTVKSDEAMLTGNNGLPTTEGVSSNDVLEDMMNQLIEPDQSFSTDDVTLPNYVKSVEVRGSETTNIETNDLAFQITSSDTAQTIDISDDLRTVENRVPRRDAGITETTVLIDKTLDRAIEDISTFGIPQTNTVVPAQGQTATAIETDADFTRFGTTISQTATLAVNAPTSQTLNVEDAALAEVDTLPTTEVQNLETDTVELETFETDMMEFDENDIFIKREALQSMGTSLNASTFAGISNLETTNPNVLNSGFSLGTGDAQLRAATSITMPPSAPVATSAHTSAVINTVAQAMLVAKETAQGVMVQLDPPEMGRVYIDFMFESDSQVNVVVKSDNVTSHDLLRERADQFTQMLKENGFENVNLSFEQQSFSDGSAENAADENEFEHAKYISAEVLETQDQAYNASIYNANPDDLRLDLKL